VYSPHFFLSFSDKSLINVCLRAATLRRQGQPRGLPATPISAGTAGSCSFRVPVQQPVTQIKTYHLFDTLYTFADFVQGNNLSYLKICIVL